MTAVLPSWLVLDPLLQHWLLEDIGRGDRTTQSLFPQGSSPGKAEWIIKETGVIAGLPLAARVFQLLNQDVQFTATASEGKEYPAGEVIASVEGAMDALLTGERVALNLAMHLSGIATLTRKYVEAIASFSTQLVDTRKTTPGLRILEKYATQVGGAVNHRMGLDDSVMIKDNHIQAAGGIEKAIAIIRGTIPYPLTIEVETSNLEEVQTALEHQVEIIMLDNMNIQQMRQAVKLIRQDNVRIKIEASGNITLENIREIAQTGIDYISTSAPITRATWLDLSMKFI
jgi:nicotinate-nucleotide pyrophosphorylase (carboxylating)